MQGQVKVAPARWWHVPGLARLIRETRRQRSGLDSAILWAPYWSPSLGLLQSIGVAAVPGVAGPRSFVAEDGSRAVGLAQMHPRLEPLQWEVVYLAIEGAPAPEGSLEGSADGKPIGPLFAPDRRAARLLGELCDAGMLLGAERIMAQISEEGEREGERYELFKQIGFAPVVRELSYFCDPGQARTVARGGGGTAEREAALDIPGLRPQQRADAFGLLQLYQECTPKIVQMAEGKRSRSWDLPAAGLGQRLSGRRQVDRWVVEQDARKVAWLHLARRRRGPHTVQMLVEQRARHLVEPLLRFALRTLEEYPAPGVIVLAREHQPELIGALEGHGFPPLESRLLMVKLLAAPVRHQFVPALEKVV